jgi:hypothetical protein
MITAHCLKHSNATEREWFSFFIYCDIYLKSSSPDHFVTLHPPLITTWQKYLKITNEKKKIITREKKIEFRQVFKSLFDSSTKLWRLIIWAKNKNHKSRKIFKISTLTEKDAIEIVLVTIEDFAFKTKMLHRDFFSNTTKTNLSDLQTFIYRSTVEKTKTRI